MYLWLLAHLSQYVYKLVQKQKAENPRRHEAKKTRKVGNKEASAVVSKNTLR
jgi:hypothetical protein